MACRCKNLKQEIDNGLVDIAKLRELFIKRMTEDSETQDRRRKDYNQAIFHYYGEESESDKKIREMVGLSPRPADATYMVFCYTDMDMVLECFDNAVKDWRRTFCDEPNCRRK